MPVDVVTAVLLGALLHASWNALVRAAPDKFLDTVSVVGGAGALTACWLPFAPAPAVESWPYLAASVLIHVGYFTFIAVSYRNAELSFVYPLMRGSAPALSAVAVAFLLNELPSPRGWIGVVLVSCGVILLAADSSRSGSLRLAPTALALANAGVIVIYTLVDGVGVRLSGHAFSYTGWMFLLTAVPLLFALFARRGRDAAGQVRLNLPRGLIGGACTLGSYGLALWAMTRAPIALVAALRETSVVFAMLIATGFLREQISGLRYLSVLVVSAGAIAIKVS
ncbi:MAG: EamA family transporter [Deltaproteobacteria bacterium]|nr:EamA family transporter [Deltaproteobacteria bacterium]